MRILIFITAMVLVTDAYACRVSQNRHEDCDCYIKDPGYSMDATDYNQVSLCRAVTVREPYAIIEVTDRIENNLFFEVLGPGKVVIARGTYSIDNEELIGWVPVANE